MPVLKPLKLKPLTLKHHIKAIRVIYQNISFKYPVLKLCQAHLFHLWEESPRQNTPSLLTQEMSMF